MSISWIFQKLRRFIIRAMIYLIILLWPIIKLNNIDKSIDEYKLKLKLTFSYFNITSSKWNDIWEDPSLIFLWYTLLEILCGVLGIFGVYYANVWSCILFTVTTLLYFNPLLPDNSISLFYTRIEIFLNIGVWCALMLATFYPYDLLDNNNKEKTEDNKTIDEYLKEREEMKASMPTNKRGKK